MGLRLLVSEVYILHTQSRWGGSRGVEVRGEDRGPRREREWRKMRTPSFYSDVTVLPRAKAP